MADKIARALSSAEWIQYGDDLVVMADWAADKRPYGPDRRYTMEQKRHAVAAIALHHQPFGFTAADLDVLGEVMRFYQHRGFPGDPPLAEQLERICDRISALLPPRDAKKVLDKLGE